MRGMKTDDQVMGEVAMLLKEILHLQRRTLPLLREAERRDLVWKARQTVIIDYAGPGGIAESDVREILADAVSAIEYSTERIECLASMLEMVM